jgi:hypothetical protein
MSKDINLKELKKDFEELRKKIERLEEPELDYQGQLDIVARHFTLEVKKAECGGPVLLRSSVDNRCIKIDEFGNTTFGGYEGVSRHGMRKVVNLADAVYNSHGC